MSLIKIYIMKAPIKFMFLLIGILFFTFTSCQNEVIEVTPPNQGEIMESNSTLANLMRNTSANNGSLDNLMDGSDCFMVNLPVTIVANGITITIETLDDLSLLEAIFDASNTDDDDLNFLFPITIILNDYTEVHIESEDQLEDFIDICLDDDDVIECANFVYPISFSIYNTDFQVIDTVVINNDYELYVFLEGLEDNDNGVVLVSLNFPVSLEYVNGETIVVSNNQELENALEVAEEFCDDDDDCDAEDIIEDLQECYWNIVSYNGDNHLIEYSLNFKGHDSLQVTTANFDIIEAQWEMSTSNSGIPELVISNFIEDVNGSWIVADCDEDRFQFVQPIPNSTNEIVMILEQDCQESPFDCFEDVTVSACDFDNDGFATFELETLVLGNVLCDVDYSPSFHETLSDAENNVNAIAQPNAYVNTTNPQTIYLRIEALNGSFEVYEVHLNVEDCNTSSCTEMDIDTYLQECIWNVVNFNGDDHLIMYDFNFTSNTEVIITGNGMTINATWSTSQSANGVIVEFNNVSGPNIQAVTGNWLVVECNIERLQFASVDNSNTMVMERDCNNAGMCTVGDVEGMLLECQWTVTSYAGSNFSMFNINFNANNEAVIFMPNGTEEYTANWSVSQTGSGVELIISNISGGNIQVIEGTYMVVECTAEQLILHDVTNSNNELVLDRDCG
jgi:hypothetical protein